MDQSSQDSMFYETPHNLVKGKEKKIMQVMK